MSTLLTDTFSAKRIAWKRVGALIIADSIFVISKIHQLLHTVSEIPHDLR